MNKIIGHPKIAILGDVYHSDDLGKAGAPDQAFSPSGGYGKLFDSLLKAAGIDRKQCLVTNVFNIRPSSNDIDNILVNKKDSVPGWPRIKAGKYLPRALIPELKRLYAELEAYKPDLIIPLGSTALWAVTGATGLAKRHGFLHSYKGIPVIPSWHPQTIMRKYLNFMPTVNDMTRAVAFVKGEIQEETFEYIEDATAADLRKFAATVQPNEVISWDLETKPKYRSITCIGIGTSKFALCVNFFNPKKPGQSHFPDLQSELDAWDAVQEILMLPNPKIGQNILYDLVWSKTLMGLDMAGSVVDTRLAHFAAFPELPHHLAEIVGANMMLFPWKSIHAAGFENDAESGGGE
jgi:uracil-DNA glycosylase